MQELMAKRVADDETEMNQIRESLDKLETHYETQGETMKEILILLRGSVAMGVKGIIASYEELRGQVAQLTRDLAHYEAWRQKQIQNRGKITITFSQLFTRVLALIGGAATLTGLILGLKQLFGK